MSNDDISAMPSTTTHGKPDVLDDGDTARIVEGDAVGHLVPDDGDEVLDHGETARVVEGEGLAEAGHRHDADVTGHRHDADVTGDVTGHRHQDGVLDDGETAQVVETDGPPKGP
ncbi:hypothetical protein [Cellulomonas edaphi]|uniref:DUF5709 domain-containing protein n=1 Tax=Cellulomonas edaphi TaxID=3053468 RepID=A0ABT7S5V4_9CELL|nr:hypothetical protein [Cellulomons edaphi]MDM7830359.1 hypothetical protein [Cellulomons edaphi]